MSTIALFRHTILALQRNGSRQLAAKLRDIQLTPAWAEVVGVIATQGPLTIRELGLLLICEADHPSKLVTRMVDAGLLVRRDNPNDGRAWHVHLTAKGAKAARALEQLEQKWDEQIIKVVPSKEIQAVIPTLLKLLNATPAAAALTKRYGTSLIR